MNDMDGFVVGDFFLHKFSFGNNVIYAYGIVREINDDGIYVSDYQCSSQIDMTDRQLGPEHQEITLLTTCAYYLARLRKWPNDTDAANSISAYSKGVRIKLSIVERLKLMRWRCKPNSLTQAPPGARSDKTDQR